MVLEYEKGGATGNDQGLLLHQILEDLALCGIQGVGGYFANELVAGSPELGIG